MSYEIVEQLRLEAEAAKKSEQAWLGKALIAVWAIVVATYVLI